ncbi:GspE/PulE family protein [Pleionea mediterranea]|jgi:general secretion pathway protein E|uniref:General secretion pathway protein E n=1 Tax=Pleionea mediterranea TaxID=523701 RepID=A0A316FXZ0_9GAMM|nr:GspE/PulE family protein [Pleionea mediterranea]PWK53459.1 general secretion pathway protein E [Pleionea mediterranea]
MTQDTPTIPIKFIEAMLKDGLINKDTFATLRVKLRSLPASQHPIQGIAPLNLKHAQQEKVELDDQYLSEWYATRCGMECVELDPLKLDVDAITDVMSKAFAQRHKILAYSVNANSVTVATSEPYVTGWVSGLEHILRKEVKRVFASPIAIDRYQKDFYVLSHSIKGAKSEHYQEIGSGNLEALIELGKAGEVDANDQHIVQIVDWLLQYAYSQRASDIHVEPRRERGNVRFRIDGVLHKVYEFPGAITNAVLARFKIMGRMDIAERRKPLDGRIKTKAPDGQEVELRLSTLPTAFGEKLVARIFDPGVLNRDFSALGLDKNIEKKWLSMVHQPNGIILVTGPTGSGKTTTLYTTLKLLAKPEVNICTIEDPIEMVDPNLNQMQVHHDIGVDFARGIRALLRQDPDIVMIGEIRDKETADMAVQASLTGHLVISTLHTNDASSAITRLIDLGVEPFLVNASLLGVMAQRLVRTLCPSCKSKVDVDEAAWQHMVAPFPLKAPKQIYQPVGCRHCRKTGYLGRQGIYEMLSVNSKVKKLIHSKCDVGPIRDQALKDGMSLLRISGAMKVAQGATTIEEVLRVASPEMEM